MQQPKVLIIEDSPVTQKTLEGLFTELGCNVAFVSSSEQALNMLQSNSIPDTIILDFKLPGKSGPQFYEDIILNPKWKNISVIPFTSQWQENWLNPHLVGQWLAGQAIMKIIGGESENIISKGSQGEHVVKVPQELILRVGHGL